MHWGAPTRQGVLPSTENAKILPPNTPLRSGRKAIQAFWQSAIDSGMKGATLTTLELEVRGDTAIEIGACTIDVRPQGGQATKDEGKYVVIWKRQRDGLLWKLAIDIFNTNLPPAK
jgi:ketosteroid isomerase-like protein